MGEQPSSRAARLCLLSALTARFDRSWLWALSSWWALSVWTLSVCLWAVPPGGLCLSGPFLVVCRSCLVSGGLCLVDSVCLGRGSCGLSLVVDVVRLVGSVWWTVSSVCLWVLLGCLGRAARCVLSVPLAVFL